MIQATSKCMIASRLRPKRGNISPGEFLPRRNSYRWVHTLGLESQFSSYKAMGSKTNRLSLYSNQPTGEGGISNAIVQRAEKAVSSKELAFTKAEIIDMFFLVK